jgi:hypothetical protein
MAGFLLLLFAVSASAQGRFFAACIEPENLHYEGKCFQCQLSDDCVMDCMCEGSTERTSCDLKKSGCQSLGTHDGKLYCDDGMHTCDLVPTGSPTEPSLIYGVVDGEGFIAEAVGTPELTQSPTKAPLPTPIPTAEPVPTPGSYVDDYEIPLPELLVPTPAPPPTVSPTHIAESLDDFVQFALRTVNSGQALYKKNGEETMTPMMGARAAALGVRAMPGCNQLQVALGAAVGAAKVEVLREDDHTGAPKRVAEEVVKAVSTQALSGHLGRVAGEI